MCCFEIHIFVQFNEKVGYMNDLMELRLSNRSVHGLHQIIYCTFQIECAKTSPVNKTNP